jgi:putative membrane protein
MRVRIVVGIVAALCAALTVPAAAVAAPVSRTPGGGASGSPQLSARDKGFLTRAAQAAQFEVASGKLAAGRAADARVRAFGDRMARDHGKEYQQLQSLDRTVGLTPPTGPGPDQQKVLAIWSSLHGGAFDCSYAPTMYADHEADLVTFMVMARQAGDPRIRAFAHGQLQTLHQHLQLAAKNLTGLNCSAPPPPGAPSS